MKLFLYISFCSDTKANDSATSTPNENVVSIRGLTFDNASEISDPSTDKANENTPSTSGMKK